MTEQPNSYEEYLKSADWKARRETALAKAKYTCDQCGAKASQVHHTSYDNLGNEKDSDLTVLCGKCHMKHHAIEIPPLSDWALQLDTPLHDRQGNPATDFDLDLKFDFELYSRMAKALQVTPRIAIILSKLELWWGCGEIDHLDKEPVLMKHISKFLERDSHSQVGYRLKPDYERLINQYRDETGLDGH